MDFYGCFGIFTDSMGFFKDPYEFLGILWDLQEFCGILLGFLWIFGDSMGSSGILWDSVGFLWIFRDSLRCSKNFPFSIHLSVHLESILNAWILFLLFV